MDVRKRWQAAPVGVGAGIGFVVFGAVGIVAGFVIGLTSYAPTSWAAALELGVPSMLGGSLVGAIVGLAALAWRTTNGANPRV